MNAILTDEMLTHADLGELAHAAERIQQELSRRLTSPRALDQLDRWVRASEASDWNSHLATDDDATAEPLVRPENVHNTLPWINKAVENVARLLATTQAALYGLTDRSLQEDHEAYLGIPEETSGRLHAVKYLVDMLQVSTAEINRRKNRATALLPQTPEKALRQDEVEPAPPVLEHFGSAFLETQSTAPSDPAEDTDHTVDDPWAAQHYGVPTENADEMIAFHKRMKSYSEKSGVDRQRFTKIFALVEQQLLHSARVDKPSSFKTLLQQNEYRIKTLLHEDGPEPPEDIDRKPEGLWAKPIPHNGLEFHGRVYGERAELIATLQKQLERLTPDKMKDRSNPHQEPSAEPATTSDTSQLELPIDHSADLSGDDVVAEDEHGTEYTSDEATRVLEERSAAQILLDGFIALLLAGFRAGGRTNGLPQNRGVDTTIIAMVDLETLRGSVEGSPHRGPPPPASWHRAGTQHLGEMSPTVLRTLACDAKIIPAVMNSPSEVLDLGRAQRLFTHQQYLALLVRDRGCTVPGCTVPGVWCQTHHALQWWSDGGETSVANATLVCQRHHTDIHMGKWEIVSIDALGHVWYRPASWVDPHRRLIRNRVWDLLDLTA